VNRTPVVDLQAAGACAGAEPAEAGSEDPGANWLGDIDATRRTGGRAQKGSTI
jgi:hypothetical protein